MDKCCTPAEGYGTAPVKTLPATPSMSSSKVTNPPSQGAAPTEYGGLPVSEAGGDRTEAILD